MPSRETGRAESLDAGRASGMPDATDGVVPLGVSPKAEAGTLSFWRMAALNCPHTAMACIPSCLANPRTSCDDIFICAHNDGAGFGRSLN